MDHFSSASVPSPDTAGVRTRLGGELTRLVTQRAHGWHRVVASDGSFLGASDKVRAMAAMELYNVGGYHVTIRLNYYWGSTLPDSQTMVR